VSGVVYLVGAGPGDPRLLTLRGAEVLQRADVVVHDRLAPAALLDLAPRGAERVDAGKARGRVALSQEEINRVLVDRGRRGLTVVRLKGGDPFVFGRGGEEALALAEAGVPFEVVPGVSAAVAAPAYAGIPVTHRGLAASYAVISATLAGGAPADLARTAAAADTLVLLMAAERLAEVCTQLIAAGRPADEPAAVIASASTGAQQVVTGTLAELAAGGIEVDPPATLVCGPPVALAGALSWFAPGEPAGTLPATATQPWPVTPEPRRPGRSRRSPDALAGHAGAPPPAVGAPTGRVADPGMRWAPLSTAPGLNPPVQPRAQPRSWRRTYWRMPPWR
jgi:uroporphyrin-III C-methyltransferase